MPLHALGLAHQLWLQSRSRPTASLPELCQALSLKGSPCTAAASTGDKNKTVTFSRLR